MAKTKNFLGGQSCNLVGGAGRAARQAPRVTDGNYAQEAPTPAANVPTTRFHSHPRTSTCDLRTLAYLLYALRFTASLRRLMPRRRRPARPGALADLAPTRILTQIVLLQLAYYACASVLILFTTLVMGREVKLDLLLSWRSLRGDITGGWTLGLVWMLNSLIWYASPPYSLLPELALIKQATYRDCVSCSVIFLLLLVARSKLVPDFALTIHFLHLIVTSFYSRSLPTYWFWWALQTVSASLMTSLGIWTCRYRELQPIKFGGRSAPQSVGTLNQSDASQAEEGSGYVRGSRRGRGRDGAGQYEMVPVGERNGTL